MIQLADGFCDKGHAHALEIKKWVSSVDKRYRDFSVRMDKYGTCLETALGISSDSNKAVSTPERWDSACKSHLSLSGGIALLERKALVD